MPHLKSFRAVHTKSYFTMACKRFQEEFEDDEDKGNKDLTFHIRSAPTVRDSLLWSCIQADREYEKNMKWDKSDKLNIMTDHFLLHLNMEEHILKQPVTLLSRSGGAHTETTSHISLCVLPQRILDQDSYFTAFLSITSMLTLISNLHTNMTLFLENVAEQTCGKEVQLSCDDSTSHCMQMLLSNTRSISVLTRFMSSFLDNVHLMCTHHIGAYVIQTLLEASLKYLQSPSTYTISEGECEYTDARKRHGIDTAKKRAVEGKKRLATSQDSSQDIDTSHVTRLAGCHDKVVSWVLAVGCFCLENIKEFVFSGVPTHVIRSIVQVLGGCYVEKHLSRPQTSKKRQKTAIEQQKKNVEVVDVPEEYDELFGIYVETIKAEFDMLDIMTNNVASMLLQALILILQLKNPKLLFRFVKHIANAIFSESPSDERALPPAFMDPSASFTVEELLKRCSAKSFTKLWDNYISGILLQMSLHPVSTFCAQRVVECAASSEQFQEMYEELEPGFDALLDHQQISMLVCIAAACKTHSVNQARFVTALMKTLHCADPEDRQTFLTPLILYMKRYEEFDKSQLGTTVVYQGSLLLQHLLSFGKTRQVSQSLLSMGSEALEGIACCPCGSHVLDAFVRSDHVKKKSKEELVRMLRGRYGSLAVDKYGSCFVMNLWDIVNLVQKTEIAEELSDKESVLATLAHGKLVSKKLCLHHFIHRRTDWVELQKSNKKTSLLFEDILKEK